MNTAETTPNPTLAEQGALLQQRQSQQLQEVTNLNTEAATIEKKKAEAEAISKTIQEKQQEVTQRNTELTNRSAMISRMGGDTSRFNPLVIAQTQKNVSELKPLTEDYNLKTGDLNTEINTYNTKISSFQVSTDKLNIDIADYNKKLQKFNTDAQDTISKLPVIPSSQADIAKVQDALNKGYISASDFASYKATAEQNIKAQNFDVTPFISRGSFGVAWVSGPSWNKVWAKSYDPANFPDLIGKFGERRYSNSPFDYELKMPYGGESGRMVASSEQEIRDAIIRLYPEWQKSQLSEIQFAQKSAQMTAGFRGFFSDTALKEVSAPVGTILDVGKAQLAGIITPQEATKIKYLQSGTAEFINNAELNKLASELHPALNLSGSILGSTDTQRALESSYYAKTGQTFLNTDYATLFKNIPAKDYGTLASITGLSQPQLEQIKLKSEWKGLFTPESAALAAAPIGTSLKDIQAPQPPIFTAPVGTEVMKEQYAGKWWSELPFYEKIVVGGEAVAHNILSGGAKSILEGKSVFTPVLAYETVKEHQAAYQKYGYWGGFGDILLKNEALTTIATAEAFGITLGAISTKFPTAAKIIGGSAIAVGVVDIGYKTYKGEYQTALTETLGFALSAPFAMQGYGVGKEIKIPAIPIEKMFGNTPITDFITNINRPIPSPLPVGMTLSEVMFGAKLKPLPVLTLLPEGKTFTEAAFGATLKSLPTISFLPEGMLLNRAMFGDISSSIKSEMAVATYPEIPVVDLRAAYFEKLRTDVEIKDINQLIEANRPDLIEKRYPTPEPQPVQRTFIEGKDILFPEKIDLVPEEWYGKSSGWSSQYSRIYQGGARSRIIRPDELVSPEKFDLSVPESLIERHTNLYPYGRSSKLYDRLVTQNEEIVDIPKAKLTEKVLEPTIPILEKTDTQNQAKKIYEEYVESLGNEKIPIFETKKSSVDWQKRVKIRESELNKQAAKMGFTVTEEGQILIQEVETKTIPETKIESVSKMIEEADKEMRGQISDTRRKSRQSLYPIFFPILVEGTEYDYSNVYPQQTVQKAPQKIVNEVLVNAEQSLKLATITTQKEEQKQQPLVTTKPFTFTIPSMDTRQLFREAQTEIPLQSPQVGSIEKLALRELSLEMPRFRTAQKEDLIQIPWTKIPGLPSLNEPIPKKEKHISRKVSSYNVKNLFAELEDIVGTYTEPRQASRKSKHKTHDVFDELNTEINNMNKMLSKARPKRKK